MNQGIAIASGRKYIEIDAYASMIAYRELLKAEGHSNVSASSIAKPNQSIPPFILNLRHSLDSPSDSLGDAKVIMLDVSNPEFFDERVDINNVIEIIDHHAGFEEYWTERPAVKCQIEFIGSVCTLIYEKIIQSNHEDILDAGLCKLLAAGILDNTLNLRASITTGRDRIAYAELLRIGGISDNYYVEYFSACETEILKDFAKAIKDDIKIEKVGALPEVIGQLIMLDPTKFDCQEMERIFAEYPEWMMNVISLGDDKSYIYFGGGGVKERLERLFKVKCKQDGLLILDKFLLRKQIMKKARSAV